MLKKSFATAFLIASCFCFTMSAQVSESQEFRQRLSYSATRNEINVIRTLNELYNVEYTYLLTFGNGNFGSLHSLRVTNLIDETLATGEKYGYLFTVWRGDSGIRNSSAFNIVAVPQVYLRTGHRSFYMDETGVIRGVDNQGLPATVANLPLSLHLEQCSPFADCNSAALQSLQTIYDAQMTYRATTGNGNFGTLQQLFRAGLIDGALAVGRKNGYSYSLHKRNQSNQSSATFSLVIVPQSMRIDYRSLYIDETGIIRSSYFNGITKPADQDDPPLN